MKIRLANADDLPQIKAMYEKIIDHMNANGIEIWNESYPCECFGEDIEHHRLYLLCGQQDIVAAFVLCESHSGEHCVRWENPEARAMYLDRLGVNADYRGEGMGSIALQKAMGLAKEKSAEYLRLFVVDRNEPAIRLYRKNGWNLAGGIYEEVIDEGLVLREYGFETAVAKK